MRTRASIFDAVRQSPLQTKVQVQVPRQSAGPKLSKTKATPKQSGCQAELEVRYLQVQLPPPSYFPQKEPIDIWCIHAVDSAPPEGNKPVEWGLLTTINIRSDEDAVSCLRWYSRRWRIEDFHRVLKSGCDVEKIAHQTAERIRRAIAIDLVIAWRIMLMTLLGRETPQLPPDVLFSDIEMKVLNAYAKKRLPAPVTLRDAVRLVARVAGYVSSNVVGKGPDGIYYDPGTDRVFTNNHGSHDISVIDAAKGELVGTVSVGGDGEGAGIGKDGLIYVALEDKNEICAFDPKTLEVRRHIRLVGITAPTGLAIDKENDRIFVGGHNKTAQVLDVATAKVLASFATGSGTDAAGWDATDGLAFISNGEENITVIQEKSPTEYVALDPIQTQQSAKTMSFDNKTGKILLPAATGVVTAATDASQKPKKSITDGTFAVLVVGKLEHSASTSDALRSPTLM
jgi:DNA-binding beta-propeller fold protein YncE